MTDEIHSLFCDGGVILRNPSEIGGTWAWCAVTQGGEHILESTGYLIPSHAPENLAWYRMPRRYVTNNETEFYAAMRALETMMPGWSGILASDSEITLKRIQQIRSGQHVELPKGWALRVSVALKNLGDIRLRHVPGHPTQKELRLGYVIRQSRDANGHMYARQVRVSRHQVWCDTQCRQLSQDRKKAGLLVDTVANVSIIGSVKGSDGSRANLDGALAPVGEAG